MKHFIYSFFVVIAVILFFILAKGLRFTIELIPICMCGLLSASEAFQYMSNRKYEDIFFSVWLFAFVYSFIAPLINVSTGTWVIYLSPQPLDWSPYAFIVACSYFVGLLIYKAVLNDSITTYTSNTIWVPKGNAIILLNLLMLLSFFAQIYIYYSFGGILGYMNAYTDSDSVIESAFSGLGLFFLFSELFPYIFLIALVIKYKDSQFSLWKQAILVVGLFIIVIFFGGLRGSRSNTVLFMAMSIMIINKYLFPVSKKMLLLLFLAFFVFMYVGRLYKDYGVNIYHDEQFATRNNYENTNFVEEVIIGDLSRFGINSYQLFRLDGNNAYDYKYGQTYIWGVLTFIPLGKNVINSLDIQNRSDACNELFDTSSNSRILGLYGEWIINFGKYTFIVPYLLLALLLNVIRKRMSRIDIKDIRQLMEPVIFIFIPTLLVSDTSNIMFFFIKRVLLIYIILYLVTNKIKSKSQL